MADLDPERAKRLACDGRNGATNPKVGDVWEYSEGGLRAEVTRITVLTPATERAGIKHPANVMVSIQRDDGSASDLHRDAWARFTKNATRFGGFVEASA